VGVVVVEIEEEGPEEEDEVTALLIPPLNNCIIVLPILGMPYDEYEDDEEVKAALLRG